MIFEFEDKLSDSPFVEIVSRTETDNAVPNAFVSSAVTRWEMVFTKQFGKTTLTVRGPETKASSAPIPQEAEFLMLTFNLGSFMPIFPVNRLVDGAVNLPEARSDAFWLNGSAWQFPNFENVDTFVQRLMREDLLMRDPVVSAVLANRAPDYSIRTVRRRFLQATGLPFKTIQQIERARQAAEFLEQGVSILDTVERLGYFDQPHLTKALKYFRGQTPAQLMRKVDPFLQDFARLSAV
jgi:AraC-like DNA-binding protein